MDISEKQAVWREQKPLFEAEFIHSQLLPSFNFNENTGDYEIKSQCLNNIDDVDRKVAYETLNTGWVMWLRAKCDVKAQAVPEGFVLMPKEPTDEIIEAMNEFDYRNDYSDMDGAYRTIVETLEKAQEDAERELASDSP